MNKVQNLLDRTFEDAATLTAEVRNYIAYQDGVHAAQGKDNLYHGLQVGYHHTRISARLIQAMAWLLAMKALLAGEISPEQFTTENYALSTAEDCSSPEGPENEQLPTALRDLLKRSYDLYARIQRLDGMVRAKVLAGEVPDFGMVAGPRIIESGAMA